MWHPDMMHVLETAPLTKSSPNTVDIWYSPGKLKVSCSHLNKPECIFANWSTQEVEVSSAAHHISLPSGHQIKAKLHLIVLMCAGFYSCAALLPLSRWLRMCSRMETKLTNSGDESSMVSKQEWSSRVFTENLNIKSRYTGIKINHWVCVLKGHCTNIACINRLSSRRRATWL